MAEATITLRIILTAPTTGVDFGLQKGSGPGYQVEQKQRSAGHDLVFSFDIKVKGDKGKDPSFAGPYVQGPAGGKFVYIDIGTYAGQTGTHWARRLKIPLTGINWNTVDKLHANPSLVLQTVVPGTGKDGGPNCATVKPFEGWLLK
ncbi:MAG: hypothetical protein HC859_04825 [Bacteroidia bacterium]|nr:hypothetical protein [Bacteroidia bacterium]